MCTVLNDCSLSHVSGDYVCAGHVVLTCVKHPGGEFLAQTKTMITTITPRNTRRNLARRRVVQSSGRARNYKSGDGGSALKETGGTLVLKGLVVVQIGRLIGHEIGHHFKNIY